MTPQLHVTIDRVSPVPLYHQLAEQLSAAIESGALQPGDTFENELSLAERLELSRPTVRRAIAELVNRGLLVRRRGVGTTVASKAIHRKAELTSLYDDLVSSGKTPVTKVLSLIKTQDARAAEKLGVPFDTELTFIERLRSTDGTPMALMRNWLPPSSLEITEEMLNEHGLYDVLKEAGIRPAVGHQMIGARRPNARERKLLDLRAGDPLLTMSRVAFDSEGKSVEFGDHCYRYDQYFFDITVYER
ncbi:MAG: GntR family transcriptional regulator [Propionibacteriaceae bacterium]|nr:GntR family transcriptional regulator [Propionibacteriaceae bacterium]